MKEILFLCWLIIAFTLGALFYAYLPESESEPEFEFVGKAECDYRFKHVLQAQYIGPSITQNNVLLKNQVGRILGVKSGFIKIDFGPPTDVWLVEPKTLRFFGEQNAIHTQ